MLAKWPDKPWNVGISALNPSFNWPEAGKNEGKNGRFRGFSEVSILSEYVERAMAAAVYDKLDDGSFSGKISACKGVFAFGDTLRECEDELRSTLEDWILTGLKLGHPLPVIDGVDLNKEPVHDPVDAV